VLRRHAGFTLVELLVVVAIVSMLAALAFPMFATARERGRQSRCAANLRQIGAGFSLYTQDWDGLYPQLHYVTIERQPFPHAVDVTWKRQLLPYLGTNAIFLCPSSRWSWDPYYTDNPDITPPSYAANQMLLAHLEGESGGAIDTADGKHPQERSADDLRRPSNTILVFDTRIPNYDYLAWEPGVSPFASAGPSGGSFRLHAGGMPNFLMADGRVKPIPVLQTLRQGMWGTPDMLTQDWPRSPVSPSHPWIASAAPEYH